MKPSIRLLEDLRNLAKMVREWNREDVCRMYGWRIQINLIVQTLNDDAHFTSIIQPDKLPVGSSPAPHEFWLTQKAIAEVFGCSIDTMSLHLKHIFDEGELIESATVE